MMNLIDCNQLFASARWKPGYITTSGDIQWKSKKHARHMWGNVPEYDLLQLCKHKGAGYSKDIHLCYAGKFPVILFEF